MDAGPRTDGALILTAMRYPSGYSVVDNHFGIFYPRASAGDTVAFYCTAYVGHCVIHHFASSSILSSVTP